MEMKMSEMIERVARAICVAVGSDPDKVSDYGSDGIHAEWWLWQAEARAAIKAMRTPTSAMLEAMRSVDFKGDNDPDELGEWQAAIDAALK